MHDVYVTLGAEAVLHSAHGVVDLLDASVRQEALFSSTARVKSYGESAVQKRIDWREELVRALWRAQVADNFTDAINELHVMLMQINDPYTRVAPRRCALPEHCVCTRGEQGKQLCTQSCIARFCILCSAAMQIVDNSVKLTFADPQQLLTATMHFAAQLQAHHACALPVQCVPRL